MHIAFSLFKYFAHGGIQRDFLKIAGEALARGHSVRLYVMELEGELPSTIEIVELPERGLTNHRRYARFAARVLAHRRQHSVELLVGMNKMPGLDVYYAGDSCYEEKVRTQRSAAYRLLPRSRHFRRFERAVFAATSPTRIFAISDVQTSLFRRHYGTPSARFYPLPPGIERDRLAPPDRDVVRCSFRAEFGLGETDPLLLFVGSGFVKKGLDRALRALAALPPSLPARMFVLGNDNCRPFARLAQRLGVADRVTFFQGRNDVPRFLFGADGLLLPAYDETAGIVILEAMLAGLPALVTENCGYAHYLAESAAGLLTPAPFAQAVFDKQVETLLTSEQRASWQARGIAAAARPEFFALAHTAVDHLEVFAGERAPGVAHAGS